MATRHLAPIAQYREPRDSGASALLTPAYLVLQGDGSYTISATGPADAYFTADGDGGVVIDPTATAHAAGVRFNTTTGAIADLYGTLA